MLVPSSHFLIGRKIVLKGFEYFIVDGVIFHLVIDLFCVIDHYINLVFRRNSFLEVYLWALGSFNFFRIMFENWSLESGKNRFMRSPMVIRL